ncbi:TRAPP subunit trs31 [Actinomortierella ambigua]|nr:TRAPP subunit trs31 [Actinomortierella ambigua]
MSSNTSTSRLSVMSMAASLPSVGGYSSAASSIYSKRPGSVNILDRHLNKTRSSEAYLEKKLNELGYRVGIRALDLMVWRDKNSKRETKVLGMLYFIHTTVWKNLFGKQADSLEKSTENDDEYMISDNDPIVSKYISIPKDVSLLNCGAFMAGVVEAVMDGCQFPARVTAHTMPIEGFPLRTTILIKLEREVLEREEQLK